MEHVELGPGGEFDAIRRMAARWGDRAQGLGDDAAVLSVPPGARLVASTDTAVAGIHFRTDWLTPAEIGWRAVAAALSDLAAMAAEPIGVLLALSVPPDWRSRLDALADGMGEAAASVGAPIVGGNISAAGEMSITTTVLGAADAPLMRSGASEGDVVYVTGTLGGPGAALAALLRGDQPNGEHRRRFAHPEPRIREARWLAARGATAAIDISDGLAADARHLAVASGVHLRLDLERAPVVSGVTPLDAVRSGEEYELLVTAPPSVDVAGFASTFRLPLTRIGAVEAIAAASVIPAEAGTGVTLLDRGAHVALPPGHDHFS